MHFVCVWGRERDQTSCKESSYYSQDAEFVYTASLNACIWAGMQAGLGRAYLYSPFPVVLLGPIVVSADCKSTLMLELGRAGLSTWGPSRADLEVPLSTRGEWPLSHELVCITFPTRPDTCRAPGAALGVGN